MFLTAHSSLVWPQPGLRQARRLGPNGCPVALLVGPSDDSLRLTQMRSAVVTPRLSATETALTGCEGYWLSLSLVRNSVAVH